MLSSVPPSFRILTRMSGIFGDQGCSDSPHQISRPDMRPNPCQLGVSWHLAYSLFGNESIVIATNYMYRTGGHSFPRRESAQL